MAFYNTVELIKRTTRRIRQVAGAPGLQAFSEPVIVDMLQQTYEMVRAQRWWDHLTGFRTRQLNGVDGLVTEPFVGAAEGFRDVHSIIYGRGTKPLPIAGLDFNPNTVTGTVPRWVFPIHVTSSAFDAYLFRVYPLTAQTTVDSPLIVRIRTDPPELFTNPEVIVPFDWTCLVNGAAALYMADDGSNPSAQVSLDRAFNERLQQLQTQHDSAPISVTGRTDPWNSDQWSESW